MWRCAEYYRYCVARRLNTVEWRAHVVLTMKPSEDSPTPGNLRHQARCWQTLVGQLRKQFPRFYYAWFREVGQEGRLHLHVLWSIPAIEKDLLCSMATQAGFGHVNIQSIRTSADKPQLAIINYVTKSLAKIGTSPPGRHFNLIIYIPSSHSALPTMRYLLPSFYNLRSTSSSRSKNGFGGTVR